MVIETRESQYIIRNKFSSDGEAVVKWGIPICTVSYDEDDLIALIERDLKEKGYEVKGHTLRLRQTQPDGRLEACVDVEKIEK